MTTRTISVPRVTRGARPRVLDPILEHLRKARAESPGIPGKDGVVGLYFLGQELSLDAWTSDTLDRYFRSDSGKAIECINLVAQSIALLAKCELDVAMLDRNGNSTTADLYQAQAKLMLNAAMGQSLVSDIQVIINELLRQGGLEEARNLSGFHHRLRSAVAGMRTRVAAEYRSTLDDLAGKLAEPEDQTTPAVPPERPAPAKRRTPSPVATPPKQPRRAPRPVTPAAPATVVQQRASSAQWWSTVLLAAVLVVTLLSLVVIRRSVPSPGQHAAGSVNVTLAGTVLEVRDRWPSMFVTVDAAAWEEISESGRLDLVRDLARRLGAKRYEGALIATPDGRPVAQWLRADGTSLLDEVSESRTHTTQTETPAR